MSVLHSLEFHEGYLQIHVRDGRVRLFTRNGNDWTGRYPWITEDAARLPVKQAIIDAECCCDGKDGVTDFNALHSRLNDQPPSLMSSISCASMGTIFA